MPAGPVRRKVAPRPEAAHLQLGRQGEDAAETLLLQTGHRILARNWRARSLELDIVCEKDDEIIFVEVKTRGAGSRETPADGLSPAKMKKLVKAASLYLSKYGLWERPCRFDLVAVTKDDPGPTGYFNVEHVENVIDAADAMGGGNTAWQPF